MNQTKRRYKAKRTPYGCFHVALRMKSGCIVLEVTSGRSRIKGFNVSFGDNQIKAAKLDIKHTFQI